MKEKPVCVFTYSVFLSVPQFATVYKARDKTTDNIVAIKKVTSQQCIICRFVFVMSVVLTHCCVLPARQIKVGHRTEAKDGSYSQRNHFKESTIYLHAMVKCL